MKRSTTEIDQDALRALVRDEVRRLLGRLVDDGPAVYSTRAGHGPPGWTDEAWKSIAASVPGAYRPRDAKGREGRWTLVPRAAFEAWAALQSKSAPAAANDTPAAAEWSPRAALAAAGLRPTKK